MQTTPLADYHQLRRGKSQIVKEYAERMGIPYIDIALIKERELEEEFENQLPEWASARSNYGIIQRMQQLYTRQAKDRGNATVADIQYNTRNNEPLFIVATDAANIIKCSLRELDEMFTLGEYLLREFPNPLIEERLKEL